MVDDDDPLCSYCKRHNIWQHLMDRHLIKQRTTDWVKTPLDLEVPERKACVFCSSVFQLLPSTLFTDSSLRDPKDSLPYCSIWNELPPSANGQNEDAPTAPLSQLRVVCLIKKTLSLASAVFQQFLGRIMLEPVGKRPQSLRDVEGETHVIPSKIDLRSIRKRLNHCDENHKSCQRQKIGSCIDVFLVDLEQKCLVSATTDQTFAALSYVWGNTPTLKTTTRNLTSLQQPGALDLTEADLPRTIRDAFDLTRELDIRYLWVDTLCIVQDDTIQKAYQINKMSMIYSHAYLTIVCTAGHDATRGIPGAGSTPRPCTSKLVRFMDTDRRLSLVRAPNLSATMINSAYTTRAWTHQEQVASRRRLYISEFSFWLICQTKDSTLTDAKSISTLQHDAADEDPYLGTQVRPNTASDTGFSSWDAFLSFANRIEEYSPRKLTYKEDRHAAFRGLEEDYRQAFDQDFVYGHPTGYFFGLSLLWLSTDVSPREGEERLLQNSFPTHDPCFPTWSWLGWNGRASYGLIDLISRVTHPQDRACTGLDRTVSIDYPTHESEFHSHEDAWREDTNLLVTAPVISAQKFCCRFPKHREKEASWISSSVHLSLLNETAGCFAMVMHLYDTADAQPRYVDDPPPGVQPAGILMCAGFPTLDCSERFHQAQTRMSDEPEEKVICGVGRDCIFVLMKTITKHIPRADHSQTKVDQLGRDIDSTLHKMITDEFKIRGDVPAVIRLVMVLEKDGPALNEYRRLGIALLDDRVWSAHDPTEQKVLLV